MSEHCHCFLFCLLFWCKVFIVVVAVHFIERIYQTPLMHCSVFSSDSLFMFMFLWYLS